MSGNILEIRGLDKHFGPTYANQHIDFTLKKGEIRGLIGENGSGKSTLISQIAGMNIPDSGEMLVDGEAYSPKTPKDANDRKISMVLQELGVIGNLNAGANIFLGRMDRFKKFGLVSIKACNQAALDEFEKWDLPAPPLNKLTGSMMIESRKLIELVRALAIEPDVLLLDEITQSLSLNNRERLYKIINRLKDAGKSVIVITHDVEEMIKITDSITVLRDGAVVGEVRSANTTPDEIKSMMVGRTVSGEYYRTDHVADFDEEVVLSVKDLNVSGELEDISFDVHGGEILGFCGLSDSGIHDVAKAVFGLSKITSGTIHLNTRNIDILSPTHALKNHVGYVPKDRDNEALMITSSVRENMTMPSMTELSRVGFISPASMNNLATEMVEKLSVKCEDIFQPVNALSGGNKQKINLGRWLAKDLDLLILDCPTRGVDVGVKAYIYQLMKEAKKEKIATILVSDELTEVLGMSDRLMVMKDGKITKIIRRDEDFTENAVIGVMI